MSKLNGMSESWMVISIIGLAGGLLTLFFANFIAMLFTDFVSLLGNDIIVSSESVIISAILLILFSFYRIVGLLFTYKTKEGEKLRKRIK